MCVCVCAVCRRQWSVQLQGDTIWASLLTILSSYTPPLVTPTTLHLVQEPLYVCLAPLFSCIYQSWLSVCPLFSVWLRLKRGLEINHWPKRTTALIIHHNCHQHTHNLHSEQSHIGQQNPHSRITWPRLVRENNHLGFQTQSHFTCKTTTLLEEPSSHFTLKPLTLSSQDSSVKV